ncbi:hypothetical protein BLNAU_20039 [Blattamonas nauphoetae]|uniref:Uncharacterized protein n=1 Tax=Blattamonas nauphoetae TaxID=2049346 RepID=A0ABQ9X310_9EUKA|nr:hypothetical protein BLNAU_20039 [Blattamonas nauphoetae]
MGDPTKDLTHLIERLKMEFVAPLPEQHFLFKPPKFDEELPVDFGEIADVPKRLSLPIQQPTQLRQHLALDSALNQLNTMAPAERARFLKERSKAPTLAMMDHSINLREQEMLGTLGIPVLSERNKLVLEMCQKSHQFSRFPTNPSMDTYLDNDDDITWADIYDDTPQANNARLNPFAAFDAQFSLDDE